MEREHCTEMAEGTGMTREQRMLVVEALAEVVRTSGKDKALEVIDLWVEEIAKQSGTVDTELKEVAYDFINSLGEPITASEIVLLGIERTAKREGLEAGLELMNMWIDAQPDKTEEEKERLKEIGHAHIHLVVKSHKVREH